MIKKVFKPLFLLLFTAFAVNSCDDDFFLSKSLTGVWAVTESSTTFGDQNFDVGIDYLPGDNTKISIDNFSGLGFNTEVIANLNGFNISIPGQNVRDDENNNWFISGTGVINRNYREINMNYSYGGTNFTARLQKKF